MLLFWWCCILVLDCYISIELLFTCFLRDCYVWICMCACILSFIWISLAVENSYLNLPNWKNFHLICTRTKSNNRNSIECKKKPNTRRDLFLSLIYVTVRQFSTSILRACLYVYLRVFLLLLFLVFVKISLEICVFLFCL